MDSAFNMSSGNDPNPGGSGNDTSSGTDHIPAGSISRHSPDSGSLRDQDRPFGRLEQRQIAHRVRGRRSKPPVDRTEALKRAALPGSRRTSAAVVCCICRQRSSCRRRRCPQPGDQRQDFLEHLPRHRDLGHLEGHIAAVADDLRADFDQLLAQAGQRPRLRRAT